MTGRRLLSALLLSAGLAGCAAGPGEVPQRLSRGSEALPAMNRFGPARPAPVARSNANIAHDFMEFAFYMESGREVARISRFEGPVTLRMIGAVPPTAGSDLARLLARLRTEAGIAITPVPAGSAASITVEFIPSARMQALVPQAACFIVPAVSDWEEFRRNRRNPALDWTRLERRERVAVFIPQDTTPQEVRDCLQEEVAQAVGPLNDLYRVPDSVFNDDNFQTVLTGFDMLLLRSFNDPTLRSGMTRTEVAARLPAILARLNPAGERIPPVPLPRRSPRTWIDAIETALGPGASRSARRAAAERAVAIARAEDWQDARLAFSLFSLGRLARPREGDLALAAFLQARMIYANLPGAEAHVAHVDMQLAAFALSMGRFEQALDLSRGAQHAARTTENAALLASLQMVQAEALDRLGRPDEARTVRLDSLGWARYGFGSEQRVRDRLAEVAALPPPATGG